MSTIEPGTPVRVLTELDDRIMEAFDAHPGIRNGLLAVYNLDREPAVQVVPVDPERPTFDWEALVAVARAEIAGYHAVVERTGESLSATDSDMPEEVVRVVVEQLRAAGVVR